MADWHIGPPGKASRSHQSSQTSVGGLPDVLLGHVLAQAGRANERHVTLVCKRWRRVFYSQPELWRSLVLAVPDDVMYSTQDRRDGWFASIHARLQLCGHLVESIVLDNAYSIQKVGAVSQWGWQLTDLLQCLPPPPAASSSGATNGHSSAGAGGRLASLVIDYQTSQLAALPVGVLPWLQRQTCLTRLDLSAGSLPPSTPSALFPLQQVLDLRMTCGPLPAGLLGNALLHLRQLTRLHLQADELPAAVCQLTCLQQLQDLSLAEEQDEKFEALVVPAPAAFGQLLTCKYSFAARRLQVHGTEGRLLRCRVTVEHAGSSGRASCKGASASSASSTAAEGTAAFAGLSEPCTMLQLLAVMLPASMPLRVLDLHSSSLSESSFQGCPRLATLTRLVMAHCDGDETSIGAALGSLLEQAPRLASLTLDHCLDEDDKLELPESLLRFQGLRDICLRNNNLYSLPAGNYLGTSLESLNLAQNDFETVPADLASATGLTRLDLSDNDDLFLHGGSVDVLARLPRLQILHLRAAYVGISALLLLARQLPDLEILLNGYGGDVIKLDPDVG